MNRSSGVAKKLIIVGVLWTLSGWAATPAAAQVSSPSYGQGPGASGLVPATARNDHNPVDIVDQGPGAGGLPATARNDGNHVDIVLGQRLPNTGDGSAGERDRPEAALGIEIASLVVIAASSIAVYKRRRRKSAGA